MIGKSIGLPKSREGAPPAASAPAEGAVKCVREREGKSLRPAPVKGPLSDK